MANEVPDRLRPHPDQRFAAPQHQFDLDKMAAALRKELNAGESGHHQQTLYKHGAMSVSLFVFGPLTRLPPHRTKGIVCIQALKGHLRITSEGQTHDLHSSDLLVLASGVEHDVVAQEESEMLLTLHLDAAAANAPA